MNFKTFCMAGKISYREICVEDMIFHKFYEIINPAREQIIGLPDGCIDIQCVCNDGVWKIDVCGSFLEGAATITGTYERCIGIKFKPGIVLSCFRKEIQEIVGTRSEFCYFSQNAEPLKEIMEKANSLKEKAEEIRKLFEREAIKEQHIIVNYLLDRLQLENGCVNINDLIDSMGWSQRHVEQVFKDGTGLPVKKFAGIIRMQNAVDMVLEGKQKEREVYEKLGYYDQAHFIHQFKRFTTATPRALQKQEGKIIIV